VVVESGLDQDAGELLARATFFAIGWSILGLSVTGPHPAGLGGASDSVLRGGARADPFPARRFAAGGEGMFFARRSSA